MTSSNLLCMQAFANQGPSLKSLKKLGAGICLLLSCLGGAACAQTIQFRAALDGAQVPTASTNTGLGIVTFNTATKQLSWSVSYGGLTGGFSAAHFRGPAPAGTDAEIAITLPNNGNPLTGSATLTALQESQLLSAQWYIDIQSSGFPSGEIRGQVVPVRTDFNGDGEGDVVWRGSSGDNYIFLMNGTSVLPTSGYTNGVPDLGWQIVGTGDFDGDGKTDILWRKASTGENYIFLMNGTTVKAGSGYINTVGAPWVVAGVGDFDGDGKADILWRNSVTGEDYIFFMNGTTVLGTSGYTNAVPDLHWQVAGIGDFDGDGKADILWRNGTTGEDFIFLMNGTTVLGTSAYTNAVQDLHWQVAGIGDFDGDGKSDILWRNSTTGEDYVFLMSGTAVLGTSGYTNSVPDPAWQVAGTGDYDGDGMADILWRNTSTGQNYIFFMNGTAVLAASGYTNPVPLAWGVPGGQTLPPAPPCSTSLPGPITLSVVASRASGVAPLYAFFDATGTTATSTTRPFSDLYYKWDFGDPSGSPVLGTNWLYGTGYNNSRDAATGSTVAHVFETPGTYNVTVTVSDGANTVECAVPITVSGWDGATNGKTLYVGNTLPVKGQGGVPIDAYSDVLQSSDFDAVINGTAGYGSIYKRILFNRGDTFGVSATAQIRYNGPGIIGAYGSGNKPIISASSFNGTMLQPGQGSYPNVQDWRVMDLEFNGQNGSAVSPLKNGGGIQRWLFLRLYTHNFHSIELEESVPGYYDGGGSGGVPGHNLNDEVAIVDCIFSVVTPQNESLGDGNNGGYSTYLASLRLGYIGNLADNNWGGEHVARFPYVGKGYIAHNTLKRSGIVSGGKHVFTLRAPGWTGYANIVPPGTYTEYVEVSDNHFICSKSPWCTTAQPQDSTHDERIRRVVWERNWWSVEESTVTLGLRIEASENTVRNNLFDMTGAGGHNSIYITYQSTIGMPYPDQNEFYNNTFYSQDTASNFSALKIDPQPTNTTLKNNLAYAPNDSGHHLVTGTTSGLTQSNNSTDSQIGLTDPLFMSTSPFNPANARPLSGSYAIGAGTSVPVWSDFFLSPWSSSYDLGAVQH
jgi:CHRD domain/FG-GAP-like repeat/PKD domain